MAEVEGTCMLQVIRKYDSFVAGFSGKLHAQIPGIEGDECELKIVGGDVFMDEGVEAVDSVFESTSATNMFPSESCQAC